MIPSMSKQRLHEIRVLLNRAVDCERQAHDLRAQKLGVYCGFVVDADELEELLYQIATINMDANHYLHMALKLEAEHESAQRLKASQRCAAA